MFRRRWVFDAIAQRPEQIGECPAIVSGEHRWCALGALGAVLRVSIYVYANVSCRRGEDPQPVQSAGPIGSRFWKQASGVQASPPSLMTKA
jgi:hypothetical protein